MSIIEFIGFIITMIAMSLLFIKRVKEERRRRDHPDEVEEEGLPPTDPMKQFLRALERSDDEQDEERHMVQPPQLPLLMPTKQKRPEKKALTREFLFQPQLEKHHLNPKLAGFLQERAIDSRKLSSSLDDRYTENTYEVHRKETTSYGMKVIDRLHSRRDMMICHEILSRPKGW
jgi:hypothetical protein